MDNNDLYRPDWAPPHCPSPNCPFHNPLQQGWKYRRFGVYFRNSRPRRIPRFQCRHCRVTFSCQTFSVTYWLKRPDIIVQLPSKTTSGACNSQIARDLGVSPATIDRHIYRLGRHCLLFHAQIMRQAPPLADIAIDSFVSFEQSQYHPFHFHVAVDRQTAFFPHFTDSELRRSGRMTEHQRRKRDRLERRHGRPNPQAVRNDVHELLLYVTRGASEITIHSDEHRAYVWAIMRLQGHIWHQMTSSRAVRNRINKLFEINLLDLLIRHAGSDHKRETIAYAKRRNCSAYRLAIFLVMRNYVNSKRVRGCRRTPAQLLGVCRERLTVSEVVARRLFIAQVGLEGRWRQYYWQEIETRALKVNRRHRLKYAV